MEENVRILVVDGNRADGEELARAVRAQGYSVAEITSDVQRAERAAQDSDVALITLAIDEDFDGPAIACALMRTSAVAVLFVISSFDDALLLRARDAHPAGYLFRPFSELALRASIELARPLASEHVLPTLDSYAREVLRTHKPLTPREQEIFAALVRGVRPPAIARALFISVHTVRRHAQAVFRKLEVHSQVELVHRYGTSSTPRRAG